jgi:hypothetical protein
MACRFLSLLEDVKCLFIVETAGILRCKPLELEVALTLTLALALALEVALAVAEDPPTTPDLAINKDRHMMVMLYYIFVLESINMNEYHAVGLA